MDLLSSGDRGRLADLLSREIFALDAPRLEARVVDTKTADTLALDLGAPDTRPLDIRPPDTRPLDTRPLDTAVPDAISLDTISAPCTTRITYGASWLKPTGHPGFDEAPGQVTWDGTCAVDAAGNAFATLSNGWTPYFQGRSCVIALDYSGFCPTPQGSCATRISYGPSWIPAPNHPASNDDVIGVVTWDSVCHGSGGSSWALLSNGWQPGFSGSECDLAFRYTGCGGLYNNPVVAMDCPDPGVLKEGGTYYMVCTPGHTYPIHSSVDLVNWTYRGSVFTTQPSWATGGFWAPELHKVGGSFVVYYSAIDGASGTFAIGAGVAATPLGPYQDIGHPLVTEPAPGIIDAHYFRASSGKHYILWKVDGNAVGQTTPIRIQELALDGLSLTGAPATILSNTLTWEGALVEGPWMIERGGYVYLFYSANGFGSPSYGVGVARATSPLGPFTKANAPILTSKGAWAGPGHGSVLQGPSGDWVHVYHSWVAGQVMQPPGRIVLVDRLQWDNDWPLMRGAPSSRSQPLP